MWGEITEVDEDLGCYTGSVANDPHHSAAALGDELRFQPHHIAEIIKKAKTQIVEHQRPNARKSSGKR